MEPQGQKVSLTCLWCNSDFELTYGKRLEKVFCNTECSQTARKNIIGSISMYAEFSNGIPKV